MPETFVTCSARLSPIFRRCSARLASVFVLGAGACVSASGVQSGASAKAEMAEIPAGTFVMGTDSSEIPGLLKRYHTDYAGFFTDEMPRRTVSVGAFAMDRTEVTVGRFRDFLTAHPEWQRESQPASGHNGQYLMGWTGAAYTPGTGQWPVTYITWPAAVAYCASLGKRLPTEAEWEYAARGGLAAADYPWGDAEPDTTRANYGASGVKAPIDVGRYVPNGYGLHDMAGNVWEYTADRWNADTTAASAGGQATAPGSRYVIRGGSYGASPINLRVRFRDSHPAGGAGPHVGFRCARAVS